MYFFKRKLESFMHKHLKIFSHLWILAFIKHLSVRGFYPTSIHLTNLKLICSERLNTHKIKITPRKIKINLLYPYATRLKLLLLISIFGRNAFVFVLYFLKAKKRIHLTKIHHVYPSLYGRVIITDKLCLLFHMQNKQ